MTLESRLDRLFLGCGPSRISSIQIDILPANELVFLGEEIKVEPSYIVLADMTAKDHRKVLSGKRASLIAFERSGSLYSAINVRNSLATVLGIPI